MQAIEFPRVSDRQIQHLSGERRANGDVLVRAARRQAEHAQTATGLGERGPRLRETRVSLRDGVLGRELVLLRGGVVLEQIRRALSVRARLVEHRLRLDERGLGLLLARHRGVRVRTVESEQRLPDGDGVADLHVDRRDPARHRRGDSRYAIRVRFDLARRDDFVGRQIRDRGAFTLNLFQDRRVRWHPDRVAGHGGGRVVLRRLGAAAAGGGQHEEKAETDDERGADHGWMPPLVNASSAHALRAYCARASV